MVYDITTSSELWRNVRQIQFSNFSITPYYKYLQRMETNSGSAHDQSALSSTIVVSSTEVTGTLSVSSQPNYILHQRLTFPLCPDTLECTGTVDLLQSQLPSLSSSPQPSDHNDTLICSSYFLDKDTNTKHGAIDILQCIASDNNTIVSTSPLSSVVSDSLNPLSHGNQSSTTLHQPSYSISSTHTEAAVFDSRLRKVMVSQDASVYQLASVTYGGYVHIDQLQFFDSSNRNSSSRSNVHNASIDTDNVDINSLSHPSLPSSCKLSRLASLELDTYDSSPLSALYVDWFTSPLNPVDTNDEHSSSSFSSDKHTKLLVTRSDGKVNIVDFIDNQSLEILHTFSAHSLYGAPIEVWVGSVNPYDSGNEFWTGGDDGVFRGWDLRCLPSSSGTNQPIGYTFASNKHTAGVTSIAWHPYIPHLVATGSYDEQIYLWDTRKMNSSNNHYSRNNFSTAEPLGTLNTNGGVWRIKWCPLKEKSNYFLSCCMYNGAHIGRIDSELLQQYLVGTDTNNNELPSSLSLSSVFHYTGHGEKALVYSGEWLVSHLVSVQEEKKPWTNNASIPSAFHPPNFTTCAFYHKEVHVWQPGTKIW